MGYSSYGSSYGGYSSKSYGFNNYSSYGGNTGSSYGDKSYSYNGYKSCDYDYNKNDYYKSYDNKYDCYGGGWYDKCDYDPPKYDNYCKYSWDKCDGWDKDGWWDCNGGWFDCDKDTNWDCKPKPPECDPKNEEPELQPDEACVCASEEVAINLLANDSDQDGGTLTITMINDVAVVAGDVVTLASGAEVTVHGDGTVTYNSTDAFDDLLIGMNEVDEFTYTVSDGQGGSATSDVDVEVQGALNTPETLDQNVFAGLTLDMTVGTVTPANLINAYTINIANSSDPEITIAELGGPTITAAYCLDQFEYITTGVPTTVNVLVATEANALGVGIDPAFASNINRVGWILNEDFTSLDNGDGNGLNFTDLEVQEAIWYLMNGTTQYIGTSLAPDNDNGMRDPGEKATAENVDDIFTLAQANADYVPEEGDVLALILDPISPEAQDQPFIIGVSC